ncbi:laccase [Marasmius fiardii PR-910]|nr:laccase [Marasmius fiardii PR-910]
MLSLLLSLSFIGSSVYASTIGSIADLPIVNAQISPDGFARSAVLAGGTFPGPVITGQKDGTFEINVIDQLEDTSMIRSTSIHWHGFDQFGTNWADGASSVNQCPITPGHSFKYSFRATNQAGTFWYHSHLSTQYCDGLRGVIVVKDSDDPHQSLYDVDDESTIITLADWYRKYPLISLSFPRAKIYSCPQDKAAPQYTSPATPDSTLINGLGRYPNGPASPLAVITVESGKRYRFRLVSLSCDPNYIFSIDGHNMTVIEADGHNVVPVVVNSIQIFAGQRYSFVLNANENNVLSRGNFWIRAIPNLAASKTFDQGTNLAILRYSGSPEIDPTTTPPLLDNRLNERDLHPLEEPSAPGAPTIDGADVDLSLVVSFSGGKFMLNGTPYIPPTIPVLLQILSGNAKPEQLLPLNSIYPLPANKTVQLSFPMAANGATGGPHPVHLHGHSFSVVRSAGDSSYNFADPVRRDVVSTGSAGDNVTIRFFTGTGNYGGGPSSGPWFLHCHIDRHMEAGLAVVFAEDVGNTASVNNPVPDAWQQLCPDYQKEFGSGGEVVSSS